MIKLESALLKTAGIGLPNAKEPRESIKGVHVFDRNGERYYEATDGHIIVRVRGEIPKPSDPMPTGGMTFKFTEKDLRGIKDEFLRISASDGIARLFGFNWVVEIERKEYVQIDRAIPWEAAPAQEFALFDPKLLARAAKALGVKKLPRPKMADARSPALFEAGNVQVAIMPYAI